MNEDDDDGGGTPDLDEPNGTGKADDDLAEVKVKTGLGGATLPRERGRIFTVDMNGDTSKAMCMSRTTRLGFPGRRSSAILWFCQRIEGRRESRMQERQVNSKDTAPLFLTPTS